METSEIVPAAATAPEAPAFAHYSTGRLTPAQAAVLDRWRARLLEDRPLPGREPAGAALRMLGIDDRPRASCSDAIAAAVADLLDRDPPAPLDLARYADAGRQAVARGARDAPACQPVSFYLPADVAERAEQLRAQALRDLLDVRDEIRREAAEQYPGEPRAQALYVSVQLAERKLPAKARQVPRGALARMAVDRWARRAPSRVAADAVEYAADAHQDGQVHRARRGMRQLAP
jgi:hypothetical protein